MKPPDSQLMSLNTATVRKQWNLAQAIDGCARHGIRGIAPWRDKLAEMGLKEAVKAIKANGLTVTGLCRGGFFTSPDFLDDNLRAIEEAHELGAQCLVLVVGGLLPGSRDLVRSREKILEGIAAILPEAKKAGVPLAIIERLNAEFAKAVDAPKAREIFLTNAAEAMKQTPEVMQRAMEQDSKTWAEVVKVTGVKLQ